MKNATKLERIFAAPVWLASTFEAERTDLMTEYRRLIEDLVSGEQSAADAAAGMLEVAERLIGFGTSVVTVANCLYDLSQVAVYTGSTAEEAAQRVNDSTEWLVQLAGDANETLKSLLDVVRQLVLDGAQAGGGPHG